jgi:nucleoside-diphosphate-sugar epimerase
MAPSSFETPINLGNPQELSMLEVANLVLKLTASSSGIELLPLPADDPKQRCPNIAKARDLLGWEPKIEILEGLSKTIEYFKGVL